MDTDADKIKVCRRRADHIRVVADGMPNPKSRSIMLRLAEDYDRLADAIEATVGVFPSPAPPLTT